MALNILTPVNAYKNHVCYLRVEILADTEDEIKAIGETITEGDALVSPAPGSIAYTADMSAVYQLSPSKVWTKMEV